MRRKWIEKKRPAWPNYALFVLLVLCILAFAYIVGTTDWTRAR
jgi:hypothetical protein